jgi:hypothetical protein
VISRRMIVSFALAAMLSACSLGPARRVTIEIPALSPIGIQNYGEIAVADFAEEAPVPDINLGREVADYLAREMKTDFHGKVSRRALPAKSEIAEVVGKPAEPGVPGPEGVLLLTGKVGLRQESQKALRQAALPKDGPFKLEGRGLVERKRFTIELAVRLLDEARGKIILEKRIIEVRTYANAQTYPDFALFDLLPAVKSNLFPALFGRQALEERSLLLR